MDLGLSGRVAMVAAACKGIGLAAATALAREGCRVSICSRERASLEAARQTIVGQSGAYTHLRAHETKHELVCRLLLEKKKLPFSINSPQPTSTQNSVLRVATCDVHTVTIMPRLCQAI